MAVIKPDDLLRRKKELVEKILRDLSPGVRDEARRILLEQDMTVLMDKHKVLELLKRRGLII